MDAKELHRLMVAGRIVLADPTTGHPHMPADQEIAHRALSLLAAAEANDGTTPETDNPSNIDTWRPSRTLPAASNASATGWRRKCCGCRNNFKPLKMKRTEKMFC